MKELPNKLQSAVKIRFQDCDPFNHLNNAAYLNYFVNAREDQISKHYGIDIVTSHSEAIKATLDGTVIYGGWTLETGYALAIQHQHNLISIYKHNSVLLKKEGDHVRAGDPIGIAGSSGELSSGPHLHFELWYNGTPINPEEYIIFN